MSNDHSENEATWTLSRRGILAGGFGMIAAGAFGFAPAKETTFASAADLAELDRFGDPSHLSQIVADWRALPQPQAPSWQGAKAKWEYARGLQSEGLQAKVEQFPSNPQAVQLVHRVLEPDTPLWYRSRFDLPTPCVLDIAADDGAHLFVDGKRIPVTGQVFHVPHQPELELDVVIRVINKAVWGGLMSVRWCAAKEYEAYDVAQKLRQRLDRAIAKLRRLKEPSKDILDAAKTAVGHYAEPTVAAFEKLLAKLPLVTIGPVIHQWSPDKAVIAWETDVPAQVELIYREENASMKRAQIASDGVFHQATLTGIKPGTAIAYQPKMKGVQTEIQKFRTLPARPDFTFTVWADSHIGYTRFKQNVGALLMEEGAFTVGIGDLVVDAAAKKPWEEFFDLGAPLFASTPVFFTGGNHDYDDCFEDLTSVFYNRYARLDAKPFYAWTVGASRFIALDPNIQFPTGIDEGSDQHQWLLKELQSSECQNADWRFLFIHQPPYGRGWTDYAGDLPIRALLDDLIPKYKVDFVVSGHIHDYERLTHDYAGHLCTFLVVGGAGGGLEDGPNNPVPQMEIVVQHHHYGRFTVNPEKVLFEAFYTDTTLFDRYERRR